MQIIRYVWSIQPLRFMKNQVYLRCGHVLVLYFREVPGSRRMRCSTCEWEAETRWPRLPEAEAIARQDALCKIPLAERGAFHHG